MNFDFLRQNFEAFLMMFVFSIMGGVAAYLRKVNDKKALFSISELIGEAVISATAGMTVGLLLIGHSPIPIVLAASSVAGHMGTRLIYALEAAIVAILKSRFGNPADDKKSVD